MRGMGAAIAEMCTQGREGLSTTSFSERTLPRISEIDPKSKRSPIKNNKVILK
jgi:hypothetical protein